jgi:hypothetical protein
MSIALNKWQLLVIVLVLLSLLVTTLLIIHGAVPGLWHQILHTKPDIINRYG